MVDPVERICDVFGVCREEAICYLDGFQWSLDSAMEACRSKTLPLPSTSTPPRVIDSSRSSNQGLNSSAEQWRYQRILSFHEAAVGTTQDEAVIYLERSNWDVDVAVGYFMDEHRPTPSQWKSNLKDKPRQFMSSSQLKIGTFSSGSMEVDPREEHIPEAVPLMASSQVKFQNIQESRSPAQIREDTLSPPMDTWVDRVCDETKVSRVEALYYLEGSKWNLGAAVETCRSKTLPPVKENSSPVQSSQLNNKLISTFRDAVGGATREEAITYLKLCNWDVDQAVVSFFDGFSEKDIPAAMAMSLTENRGLPLSSMGLPSQSQFQASHGSQNQGYLKVGEIGSSSSSISADQTETERSLKEAGEENFTVAIPGIASSQVDFKGMVVEEDSSTKTVSDQFAVQDRTTVRPQAPTTITITIIFADGGSGMPVKIPFRSNQTIRDIRNAIDELTPDNDRDYYLQSMTGVDYMDPNITVYRVFESGSTSLFQVFLNL